MIVKLPTSTSLRVPPYPFLIFFKVFSSFIHTHKHTYSNTCNTHAHTHPHKQCHLKIGHLEFSGVVLYWCFPCFTDALLEFSVLAFYWCFICFTDALLYCGITHTHTHTHTHTYTHTQLSHTHSHTHTHTHRATWRRWSVRYLFRNSAWRRMVWKCIHSSAWGLRLLVYEGLSY